MTTPSICLPLGDIYLQRNWLGTLTMHGVDISKLPFPEDGVPNFCSKDHAYMWATGNGVVPVGFNIHVIEKVKK